MSTQERFHALDAVRAFALLAGIVLHATMSFFLPIPARDVSQSATLGVLFFLIHTFRMTLFFVIAGLFARLVLERRKARGFIKDRAKRIVVPMIAGWLVLAPLAIGAVIWGVTRTADPATREALTPDGPAGAGTFPLVHLWFLYYLVIFYAIALGVRALVMKLDPAGRVVRALDRGVQVLLGGYWAPLVLAVPAFLVLGFDQRIILLGGIPTPDSSLVPQLPALVAFGAAFGLGWFVHRELGLLGAWRERWMGHLAIGVGLSVICLTVPGIRIGTTAPWLFDSAEWSRSAFAACYLASTWYWSIGLIGMALRFCVNESPVRRYVADSSYWLYLAHLPLVFFLAGAFALVPWHWSIKFPLILSITLMVLFGSYHYLVRPTWLGEVLNGRRYPRGRRQAPGVGRQLAGGPRQASGADVLAELVAAHKRYGTTVALQGLDLEVRRGELLALLGPNGAGKSTAIGLWLGLTQPDEGEARLMGRPPLEIESRREVGVMMQEVVLPPALRVREVIELTASYYPNPLPTHDVLEVTRTAELAARPCGKLSGGQKRQVQFALAICGRPRLLFLDEPTVGLDLQAREAMWGTIRRLVAEGCAIVLTTHYLEEAEALADRVAVLAHGELIASGTVAEVRSVVSRKRITCSTGLEIQQVRSWPGVMDVTADANRLHITTADAESVVRRLLSADEHVRNLEVRQAGLAEAFAELTKEAA